MVLRLITGKMMPVSGAVAENFSIRSAATPIG